MTITFERALPADAKALVKIQIAAFHDDARLYGVELGGPPGYNSVDRVLEKIHGDEYYKILDDSQIVGGIVVYDFGDSHYHLDLIYIDPAYHNRGIGTQAMHFIEATFPATRWTLDTPLYALRNQHFYEKLGYVKVGEGDESSEIILINYEKLVG